MLINVESNYVEFNRRIGFLPQRTIRNMLENIGFYQNKERYCRVLKVDTDNLKLKIFIPKTESVKWCCGNAEFLKCEQGTLFNVTAVVSFKNREDFNSFVQKNC